MEFDVPPNFSTTDPKVADFAWLCSQAKSKPYRAFAELNFCAEGLNGLIRKILKSSKMESFATQLFDNNAVIRSKAIVDFLTHLSESQYK